MSLKLRIGVGEAEAEGGRKAKSPTSHPHLIYTTAKPPILEIASSREVMFGNR